MKNNIEKMVVTRFAPSPTGFLHMGGVRTALFAYLFARQNKGKFLLRIEDTDKERSREEWSDQLIEDLKWLGLDFDELFIQSKHLENHKKYLDKLIADGFAYISKEIPKEKGQRDEVIRFKNPNKKVSLTDLIRGEVEVDTTDLGDFVIARSMEEPVYHLAVVIDDFEAGITHVIRAEEHLSNTPRQILIQEAIGAPRPIYAHLPLVLAEDKSKLSKRKHGETVSLTYYRNLGYLPEAIINFVALIGWNPGTDQEIFSIEELVSQFNLEKVQKGGGVFNVEKLNWINKEYLKKLPEEIVKKEIKKNIPTEFSEKISEEMYEKMFSLIFDRINCYGDVKKLFEAGEFDYLFDESDYETEKLVWKQSDKEKTRKHLEYLLETFFQKLDDSMDSEKIKELVWDYASKEGRGDVLWPLRFALSGRDKSPDPFSLIWLLGKEKTLSRITYALKKLSK